MFDPASGAAPVPDKQPCGISLDGVAADSKGNAIRGATEAHRVSLQARRELDGIGRMDERAAQAARRDRHDRDGDIGGLQCRRAVKKRVDAKSDVSRNEACKKLSNFVFRPRGIYRTPD
ncbi:hypothetical protein [Caballeronia sp. LZ034LL]|uniref:hypothetical protein n=1 Tax=Caballeronia sp. LZ034LL TaxID=3038567 RepID=UPI002856F053|nr:hypothetical protein [Caballeronia sp. LZ034LL]MDR5838579.1 hypothetical protein [Caballeronia sp. LZ034LL]